MLNPRSDLSGHEGTNSLQRRQQVQKISKSASVDMLVESLTDRQFDLVEVSDIRRMHCGDLGLTCGMYRRLLHFHTRPFSSFDPTEVRTFIGLLLDYFGWNDAVLKRKLTDVLRK